MAARALRRRLRPGAPRDLHRAAFALTPDYLRRDARGLAGGDPWFCDFGPELSRGFRALKVWFTLKEHGTRRLGAAIERNCDQARYLAARIAETDGLELMAPIALNIVCFRWRAPGLEPAGVDRLNAEIVADLQESGIAAPSTTTLRGHTVIRVCLTNHRTSQSDLDVLVDAILRFGERRLGAGAAGRLRGPATQGRSDTAAARDRFRQLCELAAMLEQLLCAGGGSRLEVDPATGLNAYGCAPHPRSDALAFGSSTASSISPTAYAAAEALRQELIGAARTGHLEAALDQEIAAIGRGIVEACGAADLAGVEGRADPVRHRWRIRGVALGRGGTGSPARQYLDRA